VETRSQGSGARSQEPGVSSQNSKDFLGGYWIVYSFYYRYLWFLHFNFLFTVALSFCILIFAFCILKGLTKAEAGHHIRVITAYPASLEMIIATGSHHSSIIGTQVSRGVKNQPPLLIRAFWFDSI
jgi:hypothetical protein